jgi:signal transduction histidine kinase
MTRLIQDLLDISQLESGRLRLECGESDIAQMIDESVKNFQSIADVKRIRIEKRIECGAAKGYCDRDRIGQVLSNLIGNALKFTPEGFGLITVGCKGMEADVVFSVSDNGCGIPSEHIPHIFDRFWQGQKFGKAGVGLGLSIAQGSVKSHGGEIKVESEVGQGTTFSFTVPAAVSAELEKKAG